MTFPSPAGRASDNGVLWGDVPAGDPTPCPSPAGASTSIQAIAAERQRQIEQFGHVPENDLRTPLLNLPLRARDAINGVVDDIQFNKSRAQMRRRAVKAAALLAAFIDRLDAESAA